MKGSNEWLNGSYPTKGAQTQRSSLQPGNEAPARKDHWRKEQKLVLENTWQLKLYLWTKKLPGGFFYLLESVNSCMRTSVNMGEFSTFIHLHSFIEVRGLLNPRGALGVATLGWAEPLNLASTANLRFPYVLCCEALLHGNQKISFSGIPHSRNVLNSQIFLKRAAKPGAGNTSAGNGRKSCWTWPGSAPKPPRPVEPDLAPELSPEPCWTWPGSAPKPPSPSPEPSAEPCWTWPGSDLALHRSLPDLLRNLLPNLLRNPVEPDLVWHQGFLEPSREPSPEPCWTWPGSATSGTFSGTSLNLTRRLHQCTPELFGLKTPLAYTLLGEQFRDNSASRAGDPL